MSKRSSHVQTNLPPRPSAEGITAAPAPALPPPGGEGGGQRGRWQLALWVALVLGPPLVGVAGLYAYWATASPTAQAGGQARRGAEPWVPPRWEALSAADRVIDAFVSARRNGGEQALELLGPAPVFPEQGVSEAEAERLQTESFLRADLKFVDVWRGEPDVPGRYTLATRGNVSAPPLRIQTAKGVDPPSQRFMTNPDLVVEVRGGKVYGVRSELHLGP